MIKLIVLDLDGTLLTSDKRISPRNLRALEACAAAGIHVVPSTGRFYDGMPEVVRALPFVRYAITVNGAEIFDAVERKVLHREEIPLRRAEDVFDALDALPVIYDCFQDGWGWMDARLYRRIDEFISAPSTNRMVKELRTPLEDFRGTLRQRGRSVQKIQMFFRDMDRRAVEYRRLTALFPDLAVSSSIVNNVEINHKNANKGAALETLCRLLDIPVDCTMSFGDGDNDVPMLRSAGIGVAMENAAPEVRAQAGDVTLCNDADGVAFALAKHIPQVFSGGFQAI